MFLVGASGVVVLVVELSSVEPSFGIFSSAIGQNRGHVTPRLGSDWLKSYVVVLCVTQCSPNCET